MFSAFRRSLHDHKRSHSTSRRSHHKATGRRALRVECLEDRTMFSVLPTNDVDLMEPVSPSAWTTVEMNFDPANVVRSALQNAASSASLLLTTEAATAELDGTAAIDGCFANESDFLDEVSAATGDGSFEALPASFFEPGSEPFDGQVELRGEPTDKTDTIVERRDSAVRLLDGPAETVPIEIVPLSLVSAEPIIVDWSDGSTPQWSKLVGLSPEPQPQGAMTVTRTHANGGTFQSTLPVSAEITFQPLALDAPAQPQFGGTNIEIYLDPTSGFSGGVSVATGDLNSDGFDDVIMGTGTLGGCFVDELKDQGTSSVFFCPNPADPGNGANAPEEVEGQAQSQPEVYVGALYPTRLSRIDELQQRINDSRALREQLGWTLFEQRQRGLLDSQIERDFEEIRQLQHSP